MLNTKFLGIGTIIMVLGVFAIGANFFHIIESPALVPIGIFLGGGGFILMLFGLSSMAGSEFKKKEGLDSDNASVFSTGLIRCMIAISIADNVLDDSEIAEITRVYKRLTQADISGDVIRDTAAEMLEHGVSIESELQTIVGKLDKDLKEKLIIASLYILAADGDMDEGELIMLDDIRLGLKMSLKQVDRIKDGFLSKRDLT